MRAITDSNLLATSRAIFKSRLKSASKGVKVFEKSTLNQLQLPHKTRGVVFLVELLLFMTFIGSLTTLAIDERDPVLSRLVFLDMQLVGKRLEFSQVKTREKLVQSLAVLSRQGPIGDLFEKSARNNMIGPLRILAVRTMSRASCGGVPYGAELAATSGSCLVEARKEDLQHESFVGQETGIHFTYSDEERLCVLAVCANKAQSVVHPEGLNYGRGGYLLMISRNQSMYTANGTSLDSFIFTNGTKSTAPNVIEENTRRIFADFVTTETRLIIVQINVINAQHSMLAVANFLFEMPVSGGVFPFADIKTFSFKERGGFSFWWVWLYAGGQLLLIVTRLTYFARSSTPCIACSGTDGVVLVFHCIKCNNPNMVGEIVTVCDSCGMPIPAIEHRCWRKVVLDVWVWLSLMSYTVLFVSRSVFVDITPQVRNTISQVLHMDATDGAPRSLSFDQPVTLAVQGLNLATVSIVSAYIMLFRVVTRGRLNYRFINVFRFALRPLVLFTINFLITFTGFCFAFHVLVGPWNPMFITINRSFLISFRSLLTNVEWNEVDVGDQFNSVFFTLTYLFFVVVCLYLMFNVFPSVLEVAYKRAVATPYYDADVLSVWFIIKPALRSLGFIEDTTVAGRARDEKERRIRERQRRKNGNADAGVGNASITSATELGEVARETSSVGTFREDEHASRGDDRETVGTVDEVGEALSQMRDDALSESGGLGADGGLTAQQVAERSRQLRELNEITAAMKRGEGVRDLEHVKVAKAVLEQVSKSNRVVDLGTNAAEQQLARVTEQLRELNALVPRLVRLAQARTEEIRNQEAAVDADRLQRLYLSPSSPSQQARRSVLEAVRSMAARKSGTAKPAATAGPLAPSSTPEVQQQRPSQRRRANGMVRSGSIVAPSAATAAPGAGEPEDGDFVGASMIFVNSSDDDDDGLAPRVSTLSMPLTEAEQADI